MCEKNHCSRTPEDICTCMDWQNDDLIPRGLRRSCVKTGQSCGFVN